MIATRVDGDAVARNVLAINDYLQALEREDLELLEQSVTDEEKRPLIAISAAIRTFRDQLPVYLQFMDLMKATRSSGGSGTH